MSKGDGRVGDRWETCDGQRWWEVLIGGRQVMSKADGRVGICGR